MYNNHAKKQRQILQEQALMIKKENQYSLKPYLLFSALINIFEFCCLLFLLNMTSNDYNYVYHEPTMERKMYNVLHSK